MIEVQAGASGSPASEAIKQVAALATGILALVAVRSLLNRMLLVITEDVLGVQVVKALSRQGAEAARIRAANRAVHDHKL